ncbi:MAG: hypothetical protein WKG06_43575 [Segetibacter sp.]
MPEEDDFFIDYKGEQVKVSTVLNGAKIYFSIHLTTPVTIAECVVNEDFLWYDISQGETPLAAELGEIIEGMGI